MGQRLRAREVGCAAASAPGWAAAGVLMGQGPGGERGSAAGSRPTGRKGIVREKAFLISFLFLLYFKALFKDSLNHFKFW